MHQRRPTGPLTPWAGIRRRVTRRSSRALRATLAGVAVGAVLLGTASPAGALPPPPPNPTDSQLGAAQGSKDAAAAEVGRLLGLLAGAEAELERVGVQAEAAGTAYEAAKEALEMAQAAAAQAAADLQAAADEVARAEARIALFSRDSYMQGSTLASSAALLDARGPAELIQRAAMLDYVAQNELDVLGTLEVAKIRQANAESTARAARDERAAAEASAEETKAAADAQLAAQQAAYAEVDAQKAAYEEQLKAAEIHLLELQGARNAHDQWVAQKEAEEAAARAAAERAAREAEAAAAAARADSGGGDGSEGSSGGGGQAASGYAKPTSGRVSSCYGWRWGALHGGVDIAAPLGTPIYSATDGVVRRAGPATGFGLAVYVEGDDGSVTVYGHINRYFVSEGERVAAGEQIAQVGNRGQSTGPHLHFEVHPNGAMYGGQVDPVPWLNARGIYLGGCGG
ncbi:peptidoglycan DD-metalloendopeptidase family protein [Blastococcus saxobsidens]|uniref:Peptidase M23-like protein n=1 Tax=Blastococcus saxobsidens TaxID=138336 RepID=A0A4Q7YAK4_9ACTN|nr:M23 family metallopeptidase [Blastococcus saxobsidens]RZU33433.1 peptidase M23-like protein [Blastococcus saxobsidens]